MTINITHTANLVALLAAKGYAIHKGDGFNSVAADDFLPNLTGEEGEFDVDLFGFWFTWQAQRMAEPEVGDSVESADDAWNEALRHFVENADIPLHMTAEKGVVPELPNEGALIVELETYCRDNDLTYLSADELLSSLDDDARAKHGDWLRDFIDRWERFEESSIAMQKALSAVCNAEGWSLFNDDVDLQRDDEADRFASDEDALEYVTRLAEAGSAVHSYALARLDAGIKRQVELDADEDGSPDEDFGF